MHELDSIIAAGKASSATFEKCGKDDCPIFSYTSGTTGDSKGVKLTHANLMASAHAVTGKMVGGRDVKMVSYLPYTHSFE